MGSADPVRTLEMVGVAGLEPRSPPRAGSAARQIERRFAPDGRGFKSQSTENSPGVNDVPRRSFGRSGGT